MNLPVPHGRGPGQRPPPEPSAALRGVGGGALGGFGAALVALALAGATAGTAPSQAAQLAAPPASESERPPTELERLEQLGRTQPEAAAARLLALADALPHTDPRLLEALMEAGTQAVQQARGAQVEEIARRIDALAGELPLARPAAMILRGQWLAAHDEVSRAERQLIEAQALLPARMPDFLRLRLLTCQAEAARRGGHYDEAMRRYNEAMRMADDGAPVWRRTDLRLAASGVMIDAGQADKAAEFLSEAMSLATASGDEYGLARIHTGRAILLSDGPDSAGTLAAWRAALDHARQSGSKQATVLGLANIADYYLTHGDYVTAYETSMRALPMARDIHLDSALSVALANAGLALISMKRKDEGLPLVRASMALDERTGSARNLADGAHELGSYLEKAGYLSDALAAYNRYRQLADELNRKDRQRALIELQEGFANERRQHELDMLSREGRLKDEQILHDQLQGRAWAVAGVSSLLLLAVVAALASRLRVRNRQLSHSNEQLRLQAEVDPLTGLSNRHHLQAVLAARRSEGLEGTLYLIDVDHFKQINERCGHAGGDTVLVEIARRLRATVRDDDLVVRWGGEEFLVLLRPMPAAEAESLAQRLLAALAQAPVRHEGRAVGISASIGHGVFPLALSHGHEGGQDELAVGWERAVALVDSAMYVAKAHGRNGACGVRSVAARAAADLEDAIRSLHGAWVEGRAQLHLQRGPAVQGSPA